MRLAHPSVAHLLVEKKNKVGWHRICLLNSFKGVPADGVNCVGSDLTNRYSLQGKAVFAKARGTFFFPLYFLFLAPTERKKQRARSNLF